MNNFRQLREAQRLQQINKGKIKAYCKMTGLKFEKVWSEVTNKLNMPKNSHPLDKQKEMSRIINEL